MTTFHDKLMEEIRYNYLNLPNSFNIDSARKSMNYLYRADGTKLKKNFLSTGTEGQMYSSSTEYLDGFHYASSVGDEELWQMFQDAGGNAYEMEAFIAFTTETNFADVLKFFPTAEGFYDFENNEYIYQYKDHLGNVRLSYKDDGYPLVVDSNDFYPFGMSFVRNSEEDAHFGTGSYFNYKYNGKKLQETGTYDYGWRQYMPDIGRWYGMDQLSEMYHSLSPYNYVANNPVNFVDPDGRCIKNEQGDKCDDSPGGANNPYLIEEVVITKKKPEAISQSISEGSGSAWNGLFGIGNLGSSGNGSMGGGGAPSPIKLRPIDDLEKQMNRKQQLEYQRLQKDIWKFKMIPIGVSGSLPSQIFIFAEI